ncbi:unnamed protein product, partial [Mesorhabditis belari]|uniref:TGF-beta family profile domain-containing protein n=1 Tax=Mesorhabditis belari TaxID=2138241 RepID=A0AAF3FH10_9BILA
MRWFRAILALACTFLNVYSLHYDLVDEEKEILSKTLTKVLGYETIPEREKALTMMSRIPSYLSRRIEAVFEDLQQADEYPDGNIVRALLPRIGKANGNEALLYDVSVVSPDEKIMRVELHFHMPQAGRHGSRRRSKSVRASVACTHHFCRGPYLLTHIEATRTTAVMDATLPFAQLHSLNGSSIAITMWRKDIKMRTARELVKRNPPFLLVFTEGEPVKDLQKTRKSEKDQRKIQTNHLQTKHKFTTENRILRAKRNNEYFKYNEQQQPKMRATLRKLTKAQQIAEKQKKDPWYGFGDEVDEESSDSEEVEDDIEQQEQQELVLLKKEGGCGLSRRLISTASLGLDHVVLAPPHIDLSQCNGSCDQPTKRWSPRATLLSSLSSMRSSICCAPSRLSPLILMFLDDQGNLVIRLFPRAIAENCECL